MASMFRRDPRAKVTPLFREVFAEVAASCPDEPLYVPLTAAAELCGMEDPDLEGLALRLEALAKKAQEKAQAKRGAGPVRTGSGFGAQYAKWIGALNTEKLCLWLADFDFDKAKKLYCDTDIEDISVMVDVKMGHEWEGMKTRFEAAVLGFGGKLENQSDAIVHEVDMGDTEQVNDMIAKFKNLGF